MLLKKGRETSVDHGENGAAVLPVRNCLAPRRILGGGV